MSHSFTSPTKSTKGPSAHEDLTIAEHIESMRVAGEHRPGEECFLDSHGNNHWIATAEVGNFIRKFGALHPSNFEAEHGRNWEEDFFNNSNQ